MMESEQDLKKNTGKSYTDKNIQKCMQTTDAGQKMKKTKQNKTKKQKRNKKKKSYQYIAEATQMPNSNIN